MQGETPGGRSNPSERAMQAVEEQARTIRADCQMRFGNGETFGAEKNQFGRGCYVMPAGKSVDLIRRERE